MSEVIKTRVITVGGSISTGATPLIDLLREYQELNVLDGEFRIGEAGLFKLIIIMYEGTPVSEKTINEWEQETLRYGKDFNRLASLLISFLSRLPGPVSKKIQSVSKYRNQFRNYESKIPVFTKSTTELFRNLASLNSKLNDLNDFERMKKVIDSVENFFITISQSLSDRTDDGMIVLDQTITPKKLFGSKTNLSLARAMPFAKIFIVARDPRDQFSDLVRRNKTSFRYFSQKDRVINFVEKYTARYTLMSDLIPNLPENVKMVQFEDLVNNYDSTRKSVELFLGISDHVDKFRYFNPEKALISVGIHKEHDGQDEIRYIEKHMASWLYNET